MQVSLPYCLVKMKFDFHCLGRILGRHLDLKKNELLIFFKKLFYLKFLSLHVGIDCLGVWAIKINF